MSGREVRVICDREADTSTTTKRLDSAGRNIRSLYMSNWVLYLCHSHEPTGGALASSRGQDVRRCRRLASVLTVTAASS